MATPEAQAAQAAHQALLEKLDMHSVQKTFRNPHWRPNQRRNKNIKTILSEASRREASSAAATPLGKSGTNTPRGAASSGGGGGGDNDDGLSTSGTMTPAVTGGGAGGGAGTGNGGGLQPNLVQANQSLSKLVLEKSLRGAAAAGDTGGAGAAPAGPAPPSVTYTNVEGAPSLAPQRRYCDITGLAAPYTDPKTRLRYHDSEVFAAIRGLQQGLAEQYLELRGAHTVLK